MTDKDKPQKIKPRNKVKPKYPKKTRQFNPLGKVFTKHKTGPKGTYSFEEARTLVREEQIQSAREYVKWYDLNNPIRLPRRPDRTYVKVWQGWNDFLGNSNPFPCVRKTWRPFPEARAYVQDKRNLPEFKTRTFMGWLDFVKYHGDTLPTDIPRRPDVVYRSDWAGWRNFLGTNIVEVMKAKKSLDKILVLGRFTTNQPNVFFYNVFSGGRTSVLDWLAENTDAKLYKAFVIEDEYDWKSVITNRSTPLLHGGDTEFTTNEISEIIFEISQELDVVT